MRHQRHPVTPVALITAQLLVVLAQCCIHHPQTLAGLVLISTPQLGALLPPSYANWVRFVIRVDSQSPFELVATGAIDTSWLDWKLPVQDWLLGTAVHCLFNVLLTGADGPGWSSAGSDSIQHLWVWCKSFWTSDWLRRRASWAASLSDGSFWKRCRYEGRPLGSLHTWHVPSFQVGTTALLHQIRLD